MRKPAHTSLQQCGLVSSLAPPGQEQADRLLGDAPLFDIFTIGSSLPVTLTGYI